MAELLGVGTEIITALPYLPNLDCPQAGEIITSVRDMGPDPVYDNDGTPLPDVDGSFLRASTLYRWLSNGIRELTRRCNWTVLDWTPMYQIRRQQISTVDRRYINIEACYCNQYRLMHLDELHTIFPSYAVAQPLWFSWHHRSDHLELSLWPAPDRDDPQANLMTTIDPVAEVIDLNTTAGFLPFGWVKIDNEHIQYSALTTDEDPSASPGLRVVRRGVGGTPAAIHYAGTAVTHMGIWARGWRVPQAVYRSTDCIELPLAFMAPLETYLLARYREAEQDRGSAKDLQQQFLEEVNSILTDPVWQNPPFPVQALAYGSHAVGSLAWGRVIVP